MKHLKRLVILISVIFLTIPKVIEIYKNIYINILKNIEQINEKSEKMLEADIVIKTNFCQPKKQFTEEQKARFKRQRAEIDRSNING